MGNTPSLAHPTDRVMAFPRLSRANVHTNGDTAAMYHDDDLDAPAMAMPDGTIMPIAPGLAFGPDPAGGDDSQRLHDLMAAADPGTIIHARPGVYHLSTECLPVSNIKLSLSPYSVWHCAVADAGAHSSPFTFNPTDWLDPTKATTTLAAPAAVGATTLTLASGTNVAIGDKILIVSTGVDYMSYEVVDKSGATITIDEPLWHALLADNPGAGLRTLVFAGADYAPLENFVIEGNGATVTGYGGRFGEIVGAWHCAVRNVNFIFTSKPDVTNRADAAWSFDWGGSYNEISGCTAICGNRKGSTYSNTAFMLEGNRHSSIKGCKSQDPQGQHVYVNNCYCCLVDDYVAKRGVYGVMIGGEANTIGSKSCQAVNIRAIDCTTGDAVRIVDGCDGISATGIDARNCNHALYFGVATGSGVTNCQAHNITADGCVSVVGTAGATGTIVSNVTTKGGKILCDVNTAGDTLSIAHVRGSIAASGSITKVIESVAANQGIDVLDAQLAVVGTGTTIMARSAQASSYMRFTDCIFLCSGTGTFYGLVAAAGGPIYMTNTDVTTGWAAGSLLSTGGVIWLNGQCNYGTIYAGTVLSTGTVTMTGATPFDLAFPGASDKDQLLIEGAAAYAAVVGTDKFTVTGTAGDTATRKWSVKRN